MILETARRRSSEIKSYVALSKPGIIWGNAVTAVGGFALASRGRADWPLFISMLAGLSLIIASACVFNSVIDRKIDEKMTRTKQRPLPRGDLTLHQALIFGTVLLPLGTFILLLFANSMAAAIALTGFFFYVGIYSFWKYRSVHGTLLGSVAGSAPPLVGYCAASPELDLGALALFLILIFWQMPHFYSIAIVRLKDYAAASIPVLPLVKGIRTTKVHILLYALGFGFAAPLPTVFGYTGYVYAGAASLLSLAWAWLCIKGFNSHDDRVWARKIFLSSLGVITAICLLLLIDGIV